MDQKTRLLTAFNLERPDRPPILGGWLAAPEHIRTLTGCNEEQYWEDPVHWAVEAERVLGSDGMVATVTPVSRDDFRIIDAHTLENRASYTMDKVLEEIEALPTPDDMKTVFNEDIAYLQFLAEFDSMQTRCKEILWCPADWDLIPIALNYHTYGYENALTLPILYPEAHQKFMRYKAELGRQRAILHARAIQAGLHPNSILTGEDLCGQRGPMISPKLLRQEYFELIEYSIEPLLRIKAKLVWHCDGDVRPILKDILACGFAGLQGFQRECGMELEWIVNLKAHSQDPLLIYGPISVTKLLPFGTPNDVISEVNRAIDICQDKASLVFFTSNTINPDVPLDNIKAYWDTVIHSSWK